MTKRIIYTDETGGLAIVIPSPNGKLPIEQIAANDVPKGLSFQIVDTSSIPSDRTFRNAWTKAGNGIQTDMLKAALIAHDKRRAARDAELEPLDRKATIRSEADAAEAERVVIREKYAVMQIDIDAATDEAELKASISGIEK